MTISRMPSETAFVVSSVYCELEIAREARAQRLHLRADAFGNGERVRSRGLEHGNRAARLAVHAADLLVVQGAQLDAGDVAHPDHRAIRVRSHGDVPELLFCLETALRPDRVGHLLTEGHGIGADLSGGIDGALLLNGAAQIRDREPEPREHVRLHPDPHGVIASAEDTSFADARHTVDRVDDVDVRVVREEQRVVAVAG